uniref:Aspartic proteinase-like n=1 Tax=Rhizophora mucronata TaxID=61149 RepID=A0A2P2JCP7_RHIMU
MLDLLGSTSYGILAIVVVVVVVRAPLLHLPTTRSV